MKFQLQSAVALLPHTFIVAPLALAPKLQLTVNVFNEHDVPFQLYQVSQLKSHVAWLSPHVVVGAHVVPFHVCVYVDDIVAVACVGSTHPQFTVCSSATQILPFHV